MAQEKSNRPCAPESIAKGAEVPLSSQADRIKGQARFEEGGRTVMLPGLKACRVAAGLSQAELAALVGAHPTTIADLENGARGAFVSTVRKLSSNLRVLPVDLICEGPAE
jgi:DNA-binding XRE family transcriptional regulator